MSVRWTVHVIYTAISRKVVRQNVHATTPKGNMGYDQYTVPNDCSCRTYFCCFSLALANICPWPLVAFFQISSENRADKTTHNTFRDCRLHFFRQPFSKQLYTARLRSCGKWITARFLLKPKNPTFERIYCFLDIFCLLITGFFFIET